MKLGMLRWAGHVAQMPTEGIHKKCLDERLHWTVRGRSRLRWKDGVTGTSETLE